MKITAGLGHIDDYPAYVQSGADEVFCGYVPDSWYEHFGMNSPFNRREVRYAHVQIGARNELKILHSMTEDYGAPVVLAINSLFYLPSQYPMIADIICDCIHDGFTDYIIADPGLLYYVQNAGLKIHIHLSGETCTMNPQALTVFDSPMLKRVIFHRHLTVPEMADCIRSSTHEDLEYEAFILNERCHFHGAMCATVHCDELAPMCQVPYLLGRTASHNTISLPVPDHDPSVFGDTGCGFCSLYDLMSSGITHLKIVGRGNYSEFMQRDIRIIHRAVAAASAAVSKSEYLEAIEPYVDHCSHNCYYPK